MRKDELTLPRIAKLMGKSVSWVYSRLEEEYSPAKSRTVTEEDRLECLMRKREEIKEGLKKLDEKEKKLTVELNMPLERSYEELVEYRKGRDEVVEVPILPVDAGDDNLTAGEVVDTCVDLNNEAPGQPTGGEESGGGQ